VLNPRGVLQAVTTTGLANPRIANLNGKRIALLSEKEESSHFFEALAELLQQKYPATEIVRFGSAANPMSHDNTAEVAANCDTWLEGVKTSGAGAVDYDVKLERMGKPGAAFCIDGLVGQRQRLAEANGIPTLRIIPIPGASFLGAEGDPNRMRRVAAAVFDSTLAALTDPLREAEKNPRPVSYDYGPFRFAGESSDEVLEQFQQHCVDNFLGDGLPLTPPTRAAVDRMLTGTSRSPQEEIGLMAPRNGMATIEKIAINAVMAGAKPEFLPVIIAAIECVTDAGFNLYHLSTSTASSTPLVWVNGPIAEEIGMNPRMGFLGRGNRANSTIGRAIGLCLINIGWRLMNVDAGFVGDPEGYCSFVFPENEGESPWQSFAADCGHGPEVSTVTVNETMSYDRLGPGGGMTSQSMETSLQALAEMIRGSGSKVSRLVFSGTARWQIALNPSFARQLADAGFSKLSLAEWLYRNSSVRWEDLTDTEKELVKGSIAIMPGRNVNDCKPGLVLPAFGDPSRLAILVAGHAGGNTVVWNSPVGSTSLPPNLAGKLGSAEKPFITNIVRGATLTRAGR
jgi:hypothetical protein